MHTMTTTTDTNTFRHPRYSLLTAGTASPKLAKTTDETAGFASVILHLAPHVASGRNVCPWAASCAAVCLNTAGRGRMDSVQRARIRRTRMLHDDAATFHATLADDLRRFVNACERQGYAPAARLNGTSDLPVWRWPAFADYVDEVAFYDYTKRPPALWPDVPNYHRTYSHDPGNDPAHTRAALDAGHNVAVVFDCKKSDPLPDTWQGVPVIDGRTHDFRFTDPAGVVVGLSALGSAKGSALAL